MTTSRLTDEALAELERLTREATPGPLTVRPCWQRRYLEIQAGRDLVLATVYGSGGDATALTSLPQKANAALFAAARNALPALLSEVRERREGERTLAAGSPDTRTLGKDEGEPAAADPREGTGADYPAHMKPEGE